MLDEGLVGWAEARGGGHPMQGVVGIGFEGSDEASSFTL